MNCFQGIANYYARFRPGVPDEVARMLIAETERSTATHTLVDLGTGTGQVVLALHQSFQQVIGVDPDEGMLDEARTAVASLTADERAKISFINSNAESADLSAFAPVSLVTICRAFHWMNQEQVLARLTNIVERSGVVAIFGDSSLWEADCEWKHTVRSTIQKYLGQPRRAGQGTFNHHDRPYSDILKESSFSTVQELFVPVVRTWTVDGVLGYLYSTTFASPHLFGEALHRFEDDLREALFAQYGNNLQEHNQFVIRLGRRSN